MSGQVQFRRHSTARPAAAWRSARRSLFSATRVLVPRRSRRDVALLSAWVSLIIVATMLALIIPRLVLGTVDDGAGEAVAEAGSAADITVSAPGISLLFAPPSGVADLAKEMTGRLPEAIAQVVLTTTTSVLSPDSVGVRNSADSGRLEARLGMLGADQERAVTLVEGRLPEDGHGAGEIEVVVSQQVAEAASLSVDSVLTLPTIASSQSLQPVSRLRVVGILSAGAGVEIDSESPACAPAWCDLPGFWQPAVADESRSTPTVEATLLTTPNDLMAAAALFDEPLDGTVRYRLDPERFTKDLVGRVITESDLLSADSSSLTEGSTATVDVRTDFGRTLDVYASRAGAAVAQMSLMIAGIYGIAAAVLLVLSRLIVLRREGEIALERARGASIGSIAARSLAESSTLAVVGGALGFGLAAIVEPGPVLDAEPLVVVIALAVLAPAVQSVASVWSAWSGRRQPANRTDRDRIESRARQRRIVLEWAIITLAVAALVSVRSRGLISARTDGADPLLTSTPLLLAAAVSIIVVRVFPWVVRRVSNVAARGRGVLGILGAAHAQNSLAVVPLIALTISVALAAAGGLIVDSVRTGQIDASWQRVGADVRVEGSTAIDESAALATRDGIEAASVMLARTGVELDGGQIFLNATVVAIDRGYPSLIRALPGALAPIDRGASLALLADEADPGGPLPVVVNAEVADRLARDGVTMRYGDSVVPIRVVGITDAAPTGYLNSPFLFADLKSLSARLDEDLEPSTLLIVGAGADEATAELSDDFHTVISRSDWLSERQQLALVSGVHRIMLLAVGVAALLAAVVLITTAVAGARARGRSLSLLRTMGVDRRFGWWLALSQLAPLVIASVIGGAISGVTILLVVGPALGLRILAGGVYDPSLRAEPATVVSIVGGMVALLVLTLIIDVLAHRRDQPSDVLRVGDTV